MKVRLVPHPSTGATPIASLASDVRRQGGRLRLTYTITGTLSSLTLPGPTTPKRADGLWRTTCFEAFIKPGAGEAYWELNFSPSSEWAAYRFDGYRRGMTDAAIAAPVIATSQSGRTFQLSATVNLDPIAVTPSARLGLTAVLETKDGAHSYWALAHGGDKPDFHRADGFISRLPSESRA